MRQVFANRMVAHVWAQQTQPSGRSGNGNFYFRDSMIFSYRDSFPIARFATDAHGNKIVLFTSHDYSISTAHHKSMARRAIPDDVPVYTVDDVLSDDRGADLRDRVAEYNEHCATLAKPRVHTWRDLDRRLEEVKEGAKGILRFAHAFGLDAPELDTAARAKAIRDAFKKYNSPEAVAKREKGRAQRQLKHYRTIAWFHAWQEGVAPIPRQTVGLDRYQKREVERAACAARYPDAFVRKITPEEWQAGKGEIGALPYSNTTLVRRKGDVLQTSMGAEVPFAHAVAVFLKAQQCRRTQTEWHSNGQQIRVGLFKLDSIDTEGNIKAGCHSIAWAEMSRLALAEVPHLVKPQYPLPVPMAA